MQIGALLFAIQSRHTAQAVYLQTCLSPLNPLPLTSHFPSFSFASFSLTAFVRASKASHVLFTPRSGSETSRSLSFAKFEAAYFFFSFGSSTFFSSPNSFLAASQINSGGAASLDRARDARSVRETGLLPTDVSSFLDADNTSSLSIFVSSCDAVSELVDSFVISASSSASLRSRVASLSKSFVFPPLPRTPTRIDSNTPRIAATLSCSLISSSKSGGNFSWISFNTNVTASVSFLNPFAAFTSETTDRISTFISRAPVEPAGALSTESIRDDAIAARFRSRSLRTSVICVFLISLSVGGRPFGWSTFAASKKRAMASRWYNTNNASHAKPPAIGAQRFESSTVTKHKHCATNVTRLRKPSKNCLTLLLNMSEPTGEAPGWPAFFLFLFSWAVPLLPIEKGTGFVSVSSSDQLVSVADALSEDASS
mmetsp:Transcript_4890/g.16309  ORF Transcript_4890/g.16309 Transcript_4890/m.16309 type:complete len:426 (+) Transcript_4890:100-1377(+)